MDITVSKYLFKTTLVIEQSDPEDEVLRIYKWLIDQIGHGNFKMNWIPDARTDVAQIITVFLHDKDAVLFTLTWC